MGQGQITVPNKGRWPPDNNNVEKLDFFQVTFFSRSKVTWFRVKGHEGQGHIRVPKKGRWAHDNVKLLHSRFYP